MLAAWLTRPTRSASAAESMATRTRWPTASRAAACSRISACTASRLSSASRTTTVPGCTEALTSSLSPRSSVPITTNPGLGALIVNDASSFSTAASFIASCRTLVSISLRFACLSRRLNDCRSRARSMRRFAMRFSSTSFRYSTPGISSSGCSAFRSAFLASLSAWASPTLSSSISCLCFSSVDRSSLRR